MTKITKAGPRDYLATDLRVDGQYSIIVTADSEERARAICETIGITYEGKLACTVTGIDDDQADKMLQALEESLGQLIH